MLDLETIKKIDSCGLYEIYDKWPQIAKESFEKENSKLEILNVDHIIFAGMGGSGAIGDVLSSILSKTNIHTQVVKGYHLPNTVDANTLIVAISVSGTTQETLAILSKAKETKSKIIAFSSGGQMMSYSLKNNIKYQQIPQYHSPRASFVAFLYSILNTLESVIPIDKKDIIDSLTLLEQTKQEISSSNLNEKNRALSLASWISNIPLIFYPWGLQAAAIRFKNSLQENAKIQVMTEDVIESCHNGIVSWERPSSIQPILIRGDDDHIKTKERWEILKEYFNFKGIPFKEVFSVKGNILTKLVNLIYFLDYTSIYRAILSKIDPTPVDSIDFIKKRLSN